MRHWLRVLLVLVVVVGLVVTGAAQGLAQTERTGAQAVEGQPEDTQSSVAEEGVGPTADQSPDASVPAAPVPADRTVGPGCTYASITAALAAANPGDRLLLAGGVTFTESIAIHESITIRGGYASCASGSSSRSTISAPNATAGPVVDIDHGLTVILANLDITNGSHAAGNGGGIRFGVIGGLGGTLNLSNVYVHDNQAARGGGIWLGKGVELVASSSEIRNNSATLLGGGLGVWGGSANIIGSTIIANTAVGQSGGGIAVFSDDAALVPAVTITDTTIQANRANTNGGGVVASAGTLDFRGQWNVIGNGAGVDGGGVAISGTADVDFTASGGASSIANNSAGGCGGGLSVANADYVELYAISGYALNVSGNTADLNGGFACAGQSAGAFFDVYGDVDFIRNHADGTGGAFYHGFQNPGSAGLWIRDHLQNRPQFTLNSAQTGGAVYFTGNFQNVQFDGVDFGGADPNSATAGSGGAIYMNNGTLDVANCTFQGNRAAINGGAIAVNGGTVNIHADFPPAGPSSLEARPALQAGNVGSLATPCLSANGACSAFIGNVASTGTEFPGYGGAIHSMNATITIGSTVFRQNQADRGGAIFQTGATAVGTIENALVYGNTSSESFGAGIRVEGGSTMTVRHATLADNTGGAGYSMSIGASTNHISNTIIWGNSVGGSGAATSQECNIDQAGVKGIDADPKFVGGGNYHLQEGSPAVDACNTGLATDLENRPRPFGPKYDMGAFEWAKVLRTYLPFVIKAN